MTREGIFNCCLQQYGTETEYPWHDENAVLRHAENKKWYGVVLKVGRDKPGFFPACHMNKEKWIGILLGEPKLGDALKSLLALSFELTAPKKWRRKMAEKK